MYSFWSVFNYALCICHLPFINSVFLLSPSSSSKRIFHFVQRKLASNYFMDFMIFDNLTSGMTSRTEHSVLFARFGKFGIKLNCSFCIFQTLKCNKWCFQDRYVDNFMKTLIVLKDWISFEQLKNLFEDVHFYIEYPNWIFGKIGKVGRDLLTLLKSYIDDHLSAFFHCLMHLKPTFRIDECYQTETFSR